MGLGSAPSSGIAGSAGIRWALSVRETVLAVHEKSSVKCAPRNSTLSTTAPSEAFADINLFVALADNAGHSVVLASIAGPSWSETCPVAPSETDTGTVAPSEPFIRTSPSSRTMSSRDKNYGMGIDMGKVSPADPNMDSSLDETWVLILPLRTGDGEKTWSLNSVGESITWPSNLGGGCMTWSSNPCGSRIMDHPGLHDIHQ